MPLKPHGNAAELEVINKMFRYLSQRPRQAHQLGIYCHAGGQAEAEIEKLIWKDTACRGRRYTKLRACGAARGCILDKGGQRLARLDWKRDVFPLLMKTGTGIIIL